MTPLRFALVGAGAIASAYEAAFKEIREAQIVAVCDVRPGAALEAAARIGCEAFTDPSKLAETIPLDAAIICTPPATHESIAIEFLRNGVNVLCEKPLATTVESAQRMLDAARRYNVLLTMASKFRYVPDVRLAKLLLEMGTIGELVVVENAFTSHVDMANRWNSDPRVSGGGVLIDNGTHAVDILRYFMGPLRDVQIVESRRIQGLPVEDTVHVFVRNDRGVVGTTDLSWSIDKGLTTYLRLYGSQGTILVGWKESKYRRRGQNEWRVFGTGYDKTAAFTNQIVNFCGAITGNAELLISPRDALASVQVISAAYAALERSRWEDVSAPIEGIVTAAPLPLEAS
ncbi:MAG TPA: Gfo/Idh/MocA family oxidoreductase [Candidatus Baltobacteraceae bacterium]|jgi:predicted dehydrogenase|nr:Gfo/Idh/MocA family oxidoreductase [Candidatus Baltobacteraceae bacterium]